MSVDDAWNEWSHYCWNDDADMQYVETAFRAGHEAARDAEVRR